MKAWMIKSPRGNACEDCSEKSKRRVLCWHCGMLVCGSCWNHKHRCEPGHSKGECRDLKRYRAYGEEWIKRLRARREHISSLHGQEIYHRAGAISPLNFVSKHEPSKSNIMGNAYLVNPNDILSVDGKITKRKTNDNAKNG